MRLLLLFFTSNSARTMFNRFNYIGKTKPPAGGFLYPHFIKRRGAVDNQAATPPNVEISSVEPI
jgi:hypothetical protein